MTTDVFVSHSSADRVLAEAIVHVLEMAGIGCWIAPRNIVPGVNYGEAIVAAIQEVEVMVVVVSDDANRSGHVPREVERAAAHNSHAKPRRVPAPVAVFTGRAAERAEIHRQLAEFPVVTLVGPPGAGKTELARVVPTELAASTVAYVDLSVLSVRSSLATTVARAVGLDPAATWDETVHALGATDAVLVLDNAETALAVDADDFRRSLRDLVD